MQDMLKKVGRRPSRPSYGPSKTPTLESPSQSGWELSPDYHGAGIFQTSVTQAMPREGLVFHFPIGSADQKVDEGAEDLDAETDADDGAEVKDGLGEENVGLGEPPTGDLE